MRRLAIALTCGLLAVAAGACGGDEESDQSTTAAPIPTIPESEPETTPTAPDTETTPAPSEPPPPADTGSGSGSPPPAPPQEDSPQNDTPPPAGSPAERFEQFCEENPGACG